MVKEFLIAAAENLCICVNLWMVEKASYLAKIQYKSRGLARMCRACWIEAVKGRPSRGGTLPEWRWHFYFDFGC